MSITFIFSIMHNVFVTALLRSVYSFLILFLLMFLLRWMLGTLADLQHGPAGNDPHKHPEGVTTGKNVDIATPEDENLNELLRQQLSSGNDAQVFQPLNPKRFISKENPDPAHLAEVIRNLSED
ncbi:hypothetical protein [Ferviditalea candida]|uniref:Uncharacterized protein n=1 Tax=Ferviditalea candida TaxID=3108399 RepID=A0ABU5ZF63_9BACL|nr:hypothetical protein [Paenibacillaceae bacterium T2]